jgi:hypothetical protein
MGCGSSKRLERLESQLKASEKRQQETSKQLKACEERQQETGKQLTALEERQQETSTQALERKTKEQQHTSEAFLMLESRVKVLERSVGLLSSCIIADGMEAFLLDPSFILDISGHMNSYMSMVSRQWKAKERGILDELCSNLKQPLKQPDTSEVGVKQLEVSTLCEVHDVLLKKFSNWGRWALVERILAWLPPLSKLLVGRVLARALLAASEGARGDDAVVPLPGSAVEDKGALETEDGRARALCIHCRFAGCAMPADLRASVLEDLETSSTKFNAELESGSVHMRLREAKRQAADAAKRLAEDPELQMEKLRKEVRELREAHARDAETEQDADANRRTILKFHAPLLEEMHRERFRQLDGLVKQREEPDSERSTAVWQRLEALEESCEQRQRRLEASEKRSEEMAKEHREKSKQIEQRLDEKSKQLEEENREKSKQIEQRLDEQINGLLGEVHELGPKLGKDIIESLRKKDIESLRKDIEAAATTEELNKEIESLRKDIEAAAVTEAGTVTRSGTAPPAVLARRRSDPPTSGASFGRAARVLLSGRPLSPGSGTINVIPK